MTADDNAAPSEITFPDPAALFALLDRLGVDHDTVEHAPTFTVADSTRVKTHSPGAHTKNLFLKDKKGRLALLTCRAEVQVDLKAVAAAVGLGRPSFAGDASLERHLKVPQGSLTPFALMHDQEGAVIPAIDAALLEASALNVHPLRCDQTTTLSPQGLMAFYDHVCGRAPIIVPAATVDIDADA